MKKINHRNRYCFGVITACVLIACFTLMTSCSIRSLPDTGDKKESEGPIGGDWHVWRSYSEEYVLSDEIAVCFSSLDSGNGYAVYDASYGGRIGNLILPEPLTLDDIASDDFEIEDYDGDGLNDVGIALNDGAVIRYIFVPDDIGTWPENIGGCFTCVDMNPEDSHY